MNLTGITEREQVYLKHFYDSLSVSFYFDMGNVSITWLILDQVLGFQVFL